MKRGDLILVDACVIIEAHRTGTWTALHKGFALETVETCIVEAQTGKANRINQQILDSDLRKCFQNIYAVTELERAMHAANFDGEMPALDAGELDLWIHALQRNDVWFLCGPDRASMKFGCQAGQKDKLVSLEQALSRLNIGAANLKAHYQERWLSDVKVKFTLGLH
ncbi:hypothetical protein [Pseudotabrizicola algicola]|uniref:DUF4935 domain-containing protein n=1 Tax=Pseudotabrizicola algicola TaxID=2709381 RepID=A0A6B3RM98_9RHOB|nr:hypothetical protein [Pseudotabrizicola algicola]NEX47170.1 hypothetical protein [Pseudotabrizicola algicola]